MPKRILRLPDELSTFDVARLLGVSRSTVRLWVANGMIPEARMIGKKRVWTRAQVEEIREMIKMGQEDF